MNRICLSYSNNKEKEWLDKKKIHDAGNKMHKLRANMKIMYKLSSKENSNRCII